MSREELQEYGNMARKAGDELDFLAGYLSDRYDEWCKVDEDDEREDYEYLDWLNRLAEIADELIEYGRELYDMEWKEPQDD